MNLDQLTVAEVLANHQFKIRVAIADVDAVVKKGSAIDQHAEKNTTSVYTGVTMFPMLPEKLSTDLTSLSPHQVRIAMVIDMIINKQGIVESSSLIRAKVKNQAKLTYDGVSAWLDGEAPLPEAAQHLEGLDTQLRIQDQVATHLKELRLSQGALDFETIEPRAVLKDGMITELRHEKKNRARTIIEEFMVAANGVTARYLTQSGYPSIRRVVRSPERWERIIQVAATYGEQLPSDPDSRALGHFLTQQRQLDPLRFPDLSLTIVKLLGRGEYVLTMPEEDSAGHFGLAVQTYSHSTAPNRRFPDIITQRLLKAALQKAPIPYDINTLSWLASHCTNQEIAAEKVERQVRKSASALLLSSKIGQHFEGIITGTSDKGTWARLFYPPVEGKLIHPHKGLDIGDKVHLKLVHVNVDRGFIDFRQVH